MRLVWRDDIAITKNPLRFFLLVSKPHTLWAVLSITSVIVASSLNAVVPYIYKIITDGALALADGSYELIVWGVGAYFASSLGAHMMWRVSGFMGMRWAIRARSTARSALIARLLGHSFDYFSNRFGGALLSKVKQAGDGIGNMVETFLWQVLGFAISVIVAFVIVFMTSPLIGVVMLVLVGVIVPYSYIASRRRIPIAIANQAAETALNAATVDALTNIFSVHEYARDGFELSRIKEFLTRRAATGLRNWSSGEWMLFWNGVFINVFMAGAVFLSIYLAVKGNLTPGDVVLFLAMVWLLEEKFISLGNQFNRITEVWGQVSESLSDILIEQEIVDKPDALPLEIGYASIKFDTVTFEYESKKVFDKFSLTIPKGQKVGLVGRSGAGKTTLMKLLLRHYDVSQGSISIDRQDIRDITRSSLREAVAVVPQDPLLFHRSIRDNIAYGRPGASMVEIVEATKAAQAHDFIENLKDGYDSLVGERGIKLSGGQRQRVALARAILKDAPILLLDEATSSLDSESEAAIQKALYALMEGRTVLAIAHRLSTLRAMHRIVVMDEGRIIEDGTHEELLAKRGLYADLWSHQAGGFITE
jgi:ATP-binding cassette, subfamily B, bacterial